MFKFPKLAAILCAAATLPLSAETSVIVTLSSIGDRIHRQNPDLAAARLRIQEALGRMSQAGRLANPELGTRFEHDSRFRQGKLEIGISQRFPITDRLRLEKSVSFTEVKAAEAEVREIQRQLTGQAREAVVKILASQARRSLLSQQVRLSNEFGNFLAEVAAKGEISPLDAGSAKLEASVLTLESRQLAATETALLGELKPLLGMRPGELLSVAGNLPEPILPAMDADVSRRPDFQAATLGALAAKQSVALEKARRTDDVEGGFFTAAERMEDAPDGYQNDAIVGLSLKIPLPFWNKNEGAIQEAEAKKIRREKEVTALSRSIRLEAEAARAEMAEWAKLARDIQQNLLPLADEQTALAETTYRNGQGEIQSVLRSREKRLQLSAARLDALREFHLARVRHETAITKP